MFRRVAGRPVLPRMDLAAQRRPTMSRCQRRIVSGVTSSRSPWRRAFGITPSRVASRARSAQFSFGRRACCRCRTVSWWRRIKISAVFHASSRRDSRSHAATRVIRRKTNRRHMIGDHHGRAVGATLLSQPRMGFSARTRRWCSSRPPDARSAALIALVHALRAPAPVRRSPALWPVEAAAQSAGGRKSPTGSWASEAVRTAITEIIAAVAATTAADGRGRRG